MNIYVDSVLRIPAESVSSYVSDMFKDALEVPNEAKDAARREHVYGWQDMADVIPLWKFDAASRHWILPRGYATELFSDLDSLGIPFDLHDYRRRLPHSATLMPVPVRAYQIAMVEKLLKVEQGVLEAPPGSGKTVASLELIRRSQQKAIVIVDKTNIARQWVERCQEFMGYTPGVIGDGHFDDTRAITIALVQTLWSKQEQLLQSDWFGDFGLVLLDECHHAPARTFTETIQLFPAFYRFGVSATPERREGLWQQLSATIGPLAHRVTKGDLRSLGVLVSPKVVVHTTGFQRTYFPTHKFVNSGVCDRMGCTRPHHKKLHRNNYTDIVGELASDSGRNHLIASQALNDYRDGRSVLVVSSRKSQLHAIHDTMVEMGVNDRDLYMLTGDQDTGERMEIARIADAGRCIILSTIADEALDIPRLDSLHLAWPTRNTQKVRQQLGRVERTHKDKRDAIVHDYADDVGPLRGQLADRFSEVYVKEGLQTEVPSWLSRN